VRSDGSGQVKLLAFLLQIFPDGHSGDGFSFIFGWIRLGFFGDIRVIKQIKN